MLKHILGIVLLIFFLPVGLGIVSFLLEDPFTQGFEDGLKLTGAAIIIFLLFELIKYLLS